MSGSTSSQSSTDKGNQSKSDRVRDQNSYVTSICDIYIDDVLIHGPTDNEYLGNTRKVLGRLREKKVTANPAKTRLGLKEVEYVGHLISSTGTSFTPKRIVSRSLTSHFQKLRRHFCSSLD